MSPGLCSNRSRGDIQFLHSFVVTFTAYIRFTPESFFMVDLIVPSNARVAFSLQ
jgi:hypothetical protein